MRSLCVAALLLVACAPASTGGGGRTDGGRRRDAGGASDGGRDGGGGDGDGGGFDSGPRDAAPVELDAAACGELIAVLRDFRADHPDFEDYLGSLRGIVEATIGTDGKPVYAHGGSTAVTTGRAEFDQWYRDVPGVNMRFEMPLPLSEGPPGFFVFDDGEFFPLDGMGFPGEEMLGHNFHFTTEIHAMFRYRGGELFTFRGDDDVFVFVNGRLALDLGGVHAVESGTIDFDAMAGALGISAGGTYSFDVFHAERHTSESNFRLETSIDCFILE